MGLIDEFRPQCCSGHDMTQPQAPETSAETDRRFLQKLHIGKRYILSLFNLMFLLTTDSGERQLICRDINLSLPLWCTFLLRKTSFS